MARSEPGSQAADRAEAGQSSKSAKLEFSVADALAEWDTIDWFACSDPGPTWLSRLPATWPS